MTAVGLLLAGVVGGAVSGVGGQPTSATFSAPTLDRWMYSFNQASPLGSETQATVFSSLGSPLQSSFDNRDGQWLLGYSTGSAVPSGLGVDRYRVIQARVVARISRDVAFTYDPSHDALATYFAATDAEFVADSDPGARPIELFGVGYRNGFTAQTFAENSPHSPGAPFPNKRVRNAFAAEFAPAGGAAVDVSNNVDDRFEVHPWAVGQCGVAPGAAVPLDTDFTFDINLSAGGAAASFESGLNDGRINLMITALTLTDQQASTVPAFYTKEYPASIGGVPARLELSVCVGPRGDWDCNGQVQPADVALFVNQWLADLTAGTNRTDLDRNGAVEPADVAAFVSVWFGSL